LPENIHQETFHPKMHNKDFTKGQRGKFGKCFSLWSLKNWQMGKPLKMIY